MTLYLAWSPVPPIVILASRDVKSLGGLGCSILHKLKIYWQKKEVGAKRLRLSVTQEGKKQAFCFPLFMQNLQRKQLRLRH